MKTLNVSAGGKGTRISNYTTTITEDFPKHILPIPTLGGTILGEIIRKAESNFDKVVVWTSINNNRQIKESLKASAKTTIAIDTNMTGPLGPVIRSVIKSDTTSYGCAGDFYHDFSWQEFEYFHNSHKLPISILVSRSVPTSDGAIFHTDGKIVTGWERKSATTDLDKINIGCYIIDPTPDVKSILNTLERHKEDPFFDAFIAKALVAGYDPGHIGFNINTLDVYNELVSRLS